MDSVKSIFGKDPVPEDKLAQLCSHPGVETDDSPLDDSVFENIACEMQARGLLPEWARRPRTYFILRQIKRINLMSTFIDWGLNDTSIPYGSRKALPMPHGKFFSPFDADDFLRWQVVCSSKTLRFEQGEHCRIADGDSLFEAQKLRLGTGSRRVTTVDRVISKATGKVYARKRLERRKLPTERETLKTFERELQSLTRLKDYEHLVKVVGTYTDKKYLALILSPVADCTLKHYLLACNPLNDESKRSLISYFGCMAKVIAVLHEELNILHKDIKLDNYLLKDGKLILTDFGTAFDWSKTDHSMTLANRGDARTERYASPEVVKSGEFHRASDIWSLGVVYLEITTVLHGKSLKDLDTHLCNHGARSVHIYENHEAALSWFSVLRGQNQLAAENEPLSWVLSMLEPMHLQRISAINLFETIASFQGGRFCGNCCLEQESDFSSESSLLATDDEEETQRPLRSLGKNPAESSVPLFSMPGQYPSIAEFSHYRQPAFLNPGVNIPGQEKPSARSSFEGEAPVPRLTSQQEENNTIPSNSSPVSSAIPSKASRLQRQKQKPANVDTVAPRGLGLFATPNIVGKTSRSKSRARSRRQSVSTPSDAPTKTDQRIQHFLSTLPVDGQQYDNTLEMPPDPTSAILHSRNSNDQIDRFLLRKPSRRHSQNDLRSVLDQEHAIQAQDSDVFSSKLIHYASDADLTHHQYDPGEGWKAMLSELKILPESVLSSPLLATPSSATNQMAKESSPRVGWKAIVDESRGLPEIDQSSSLPSSPSTPMKETVKEKSLRFEEQDFPQSSPSVNQPRVSTLEGVDLFRPDSDQAEASRVSSVQGVRSHGEEVLKTTPKATQSNPEDLNPSAQRPNVTRPVSQGMPPAAPSSGPQSLGSFLEKVPPAPKQKKQWERASVIMQKILNDKASVAPTSVVSARTRALISGRPVMRWNDSYYGYLPKFVALGKVAATRELLAGGCNPGKRENPRWQPVFAAIKGRSDKHNKCLIALIGAGADVNARRSTVCDGKSYLHHAIAQTPWSGYSSTVYILLKGGANPNSRDRAGNVPFLMLLKGTGLLNPQEREALLIILAPEFNTEISIIDMKLNENVLHMAIRRKDPHTLDAILDRVTDSESKKQMLENRNASGFTPLLLVVNICSFANEEAAETALRMLELLLDNGANPDDHDAETWNSSLHLVLTQHKHTETFELLVRYKATPLLGNKQQLSPRRILANKLLEKPVDGWYESVARKVAHIPDWQVSPITAYRLPVDQSRKTASSKLP